MKPDLEIYTDKVDQSARPIIRERTSMPATEIMELLAPEHIFLSLAEIELTLFQAVMHVL